MKEWTDWTVHGTICDMDKKKIGQRVRGIGEWVPWMMSSGIASFAVWEYYYGWYTPAVFLILAAMYVRDV